MKIKFKKPEIKMPNIKFKKPSKKTVIITSTVIAVIVAVLLILSASVNNIACAGYEAEIEKTVSDIKDVKVLEVISGCGSISGKEDETRTWVGVLVETKLSPMNLRELVDGEWGIHNFKDIGGATRAMKNMDKSFSEFEESRYKSYYIIEFAKEAPMSLFDLR